MLRVALLLITVAVLIAGCWTTSVYAQDDAAPPANQTPEQERTDATDGAPSPAGPDTTPAASTACPVDSTEPCITGPSTTGPCIDTRAIPRFVENSPFQNDDASSQFKPERRLWATSYLWSKAPELVVEQWLTEQPELQGKYVLIEFWATWCPPCRRSLALLNALHEKYGQELVVIGICEEDEQAVRSLCDRHPQTEQIKFFSALDTRKRMKEQLGVWGIPHAILLEPDGYVIWEGFPLQPGYELSETIIERILEVGRKLRSGQPPAGEKP
jgi:thiol-disulfide isomerase/thioredoxin